MSRVKPKADGGKHKKSEHPRTRSPKPKSLVEFFRKAPLAKVKIDLERKPDCGRNIDL
jgi:hypothetical protein